MNNQPETKALTKLEKELLTALKRIEAIAHYHHYHSSIVGIPDDLKDAFLGIVEEASDAIALTK